MSGTWEGTFRNYHGACSRFRLSKGALVVINDQMQELMGVKAIFTDEGKGRVRLLIDDRDVYLGIYRREGERIIACFGKKQRPKDFHLTEERCLFTLYRVKHRK